MKTTIETVLCREDANGEDVEVDVVVSGIVRWEPDEWLQCHIVEDLVTSIPVSGDEYDQLERELVAAAESEATWRYDDRYDI